ncbi:MAG: prepilin-type N-terminal cleavage/methylation domain-containing protein [Candidatus Omnitrophota bacterium]
MKSFTLVEVMIALTVFALVITGAGNTFFFMIEAWARQKNGVDLVQNTRWAADFLSGEIRQAGNIDDTSPFIGITNICSCELDRDGNFMNGPEIRVWYWRGFSVGSNNYGDPDKLYRGADNNPIEAGRQQSFIEADQNRRELANFIVDNPIDGGTGSPYPIFDQSGGITQFWLTVSLDSKSYTLRSQIRGRN